MAHLHCIALRTVRVSDNTSILTAWSQEAGRVSIAVPAGDSREARRRRALMMPLSMFEGVNTVNKPREIITLRDIKPSLVSVGIATNPVKGMIAMFLADVLTHVLNESQRDDALWHFLSKSVTYFNRVSNATAVANFHIYFLVALAQMLGLQPDVAEYKKGFVFDVLEGRFIPTPPLHRHFLDGERAEMAAKILRMNLRNLHLWKLNRRSRAEILDAILNYYSLHHTKLNELVVLKIVRDLSV